MAGHQIRKFLKKHIADYPTPTLLTHFIKLHDK
jgi:hypothetical protein